MVFKIRLTSIIYQHSHLFASATHQNQAVLINGIRIFFALAFPYSKTECSSFFISILRTLKDIFFKISCRSSASFSRLLTRSTSKNSGVIFLGK